MLSFLRYFAPVTRPFFEHSLLILYAADSNHLIRRVIVTYPYILLNISVANSHATSTYECELQRGNVAHSLRLLMQLVNTAVVFFKRPKLIDAFILATLKQ